MHVSILPQTPLLFRLPHPCAVHRSMLVIHFKYSPVFMSIPNSLTIPPHLATISSFSKSVSLLLSCKQVHLYHFFLDSTYKGYRVIFLLPCLTYFTQDDNLGPSMLLQMALFHSFRFLCIYVPHLPYPRLCWWTFRSRPCHGYCKQCYNEYWGVHVLLNHDFLWIYAQEWNSHCFFFFLGFLLI